MRSPNAYMNQTGDVLSALKWIREPIEVRREYFIRLVPDNGGIKTPTADSDRLVAEIRELVVERNAQETISGEALARAQKNLGLKNAELCALLGVSEASLCNWKHDRIPVPGPVCIAIELLLKLNATKQ